MTVEFSRWRSRIFAFGVLALVVAMALLAPMAALAVVNINPPGGSAPQGGTVTADVNVQPPTPPSCLDSTGEPAGVLVVFDPVCSPQPTWPSKMTVSVGSSTPPGTYTFGVFDFDDSVQPNQMWDPGEKKEPDHMWDLTVEAPPLSSSTPTSPPPGTVVVPDFGVSCDPSSLSTMPGGSAPSTCTVTSKGGFKGSVSLSCAGLPESVACTFGPNTVNLEPNQTATSALTVATSSDTPPGDLPFDVVGKSRSATRKAPMKLTVSAKPTLPPKPQGPKVLGLDRPSTEPGGEVIAIGKGCDPEGPVTLLIEGTDVGSGSTDTLGNFSIPIKLPQSAGVGRHEVEARCGPTLFTSVDVVVLARSQNATGPIATLAVLVFFMLEVRRMLRRESGISPRR